MTGVFKIRGAWAYLEVGYDTGRYYRRLFFRQFGLKLERPSNNEHITIISPYDAIDIATVGCYNGVIMNFEVKMNLWWNGSAIWLPVISEEIVALRKSLSLGVADRKPHLCIGYLN